MAKVRTDAMFHLCKPGSNIFDTGGPNRAFLRKSHHWRRPALLLSFALCLLAAFLCPATTATSAEPSEPAGDAAPSAVERYRLSHPELSPEEVQQLNPRTEAQQKRVDAVAYFMAGQLKEKRNDFEGALKAYRKAMELDPNSIEVYRAIIPLAFNLNQTADAVKYALRAIEIDPKDFRLLRRLGSHMDRLGQTAQAIELLEKASQSPVIEKASGNYVSLMRDLAVLYIATGNQEKAATAYETVFEARVDPEKFHLEYRTRKRLSQDRRTSFERIGKAFLAADRTELAIQAFERAAKESKGNPGTLSYNLATVYFQTDQTEKALERLQKYFDLQLQSKGREAYRLLADILEKLAKTDELIPRLEALAEDDLRNSTLQYFLAEQYVAQNRLEEAETLYKSVLNDSGDAVGYVGLAGVYRRQKRAAELLDAVARAADAGKNLRQLQVEMDAITKDEPLLGELLAVGSQRLEAEAPQLNFAAGLILAKLAAVAKKTEVAVAFYRFALAKEPKAAAIILKELGQHLQDVERYSEAAKAYQEAVDLPGLVAVKPEFLLRLSHAHELNGNTDGALTAVKEARSLRPDLVQLHYQEAWILYHSRRWDEAIRVFQEVIDKYAHEKGILRMCQFSLSNIYVQRGDIRKGEEILEQVLAEEPDDPSVNNDLGYLYADQGKNLEQAESMIKKAIDAEPDNPAYLDSMGWVLYKLGKHVDALPYLEKAIETPTGSDATIWEHLGDCCDKLQQTDKAEEAWRKALDEAHKQPQPDQKMIERIDAKLKKTAGNASQTQSATSSAP
jgi:tetratricopeptide (TPR) repeat protein